MKILRSLQYFFFLVLSPYWRLHRHGASALYLIMLSSVFISGCIATQQDMLQIQSQMDDLNHALNNMQKNQAELAVKIDNLSVNLNIFAENVRDLSDQMNKLSGRIEEIDSMLSKKVNAIGQRIKKQQENVETTLLPAKIYNDAYSSFLNNNYDAAINGFKTYLSRFPSGDMVESAYYNLGESLYIKERWQEAAISYANVLEKFPKSPRTPHVRLKYALSILKLSKDKEPEAVKYLKSIVRDFPKSQEAKIAKKHINRIKSPTQPDKKTRPQRNPGKKN